jgi:hypothetical protein
VAAGTEFSVFAEARFGTHVGGGWAAITNTDGADAWERYAQGGNRVRAVVRADRRPGTAEVTLPDHVGVPAAFPSSRCSATARRCATSFT